MKPKLVDLFCGQGGATKGLQRAGFYVVGVDQKPQPRYCGDEFYQADALTFPLEEFDGIWASPPCQAFTRLRFMPTAKQHHNLIPATRERLIASGKPYCIENVEESPLGESGHLIMLCGSMFGLQTPDGRAELRRHRLFETSFSIPLWPRCQHGYAGSLTVVGTGLDSNTNRQQRRVRSLSVCGDYAEVAAERQRDRKVLTVAGHTPVDNTRRRTAICVAGTGLPLAGRMPPKRKAISVVGHGAPQLKDSITVAGERAMGSHGGRRAITVVGSTPQTNIDRNRTRETFSIDDARAAMGIEWMTMAGLSQAIPPAYSEFIGRHMIQIVEAE